MKLVRLYVDVTRKNVIENDVLYERALVVLLIVKALYVSESDCKKLGSFISLAVRALCEGYAVVLSRSCDEAIGVTLVADSSVRVSKLFSDSLS